MEQIKISQSEAIMYIALVGLVIGFLLGLIPLILGIKKEKRNYGYYGFAASALLGLVSPILSVIAVAVFHPADSKKTDCQSTDCRSHCPTKNLLRFQSTIPKILRICLPL